MSQIRNMGRLRIRTWDVSLDSLDDVETFDVLVLKDL